MSDMFKIAKNGQWTLEKSAAPKLTNNEPSIAAHVGKTHTVEVHPDMDMLYRAKGLIKENNRPHLSIQHFKKAGFPHDIVKKLPRDGNGHVTPEMIDKHIEGLPKTKVNVQVLPYSWGSQQHRPGDQYALSVQLHPDEKAKMSDDSKNVWDSISGSQHLFNKDSKDQIGWSRIDPHSKENHWHIDEVQSDFQHKNKITGALANMREPFSDKEYEIKRLKAIDKHNGIEPKTDKEYEATVNKQLEDWNKLKEHIKNAGDGSSLLAHLSHGHEDPQHLVHSATNALARKLGGVNSISMDTPHDQARQSNLRNEKENRRRNDTVSDNEDSISGTEWQRHIHDFKNNQHDAFKNPNFKSALDKIGGLDNLTKLVRNSDYSTSQGDMMNNVKEDSPDLHAAVSKLSHPERDAIWDLISGHHEHVRSKAEEMADDDTESYQDDEEELDVPVHQVHTYNKRPKRLGMKIVPKEDILGSHPDDKSKSVQYMNLHKKLSSLLEQLKKTNLK